MNKLSSLLVGGALLVGLAIAAPAERGHHRGSPLDHLKSSLNLTDDQVAKLQPTFDSMRQKHQAERQAFEAKMKTILTPEQQQKMAEARKEHKRGGFRDLNLTEDQKAQMKAFWESQRGTKKANWEAERAQVDSQLQATLTPEQMTKYNEMKAKMKERWAEKGGRRGHHGPRPGGDDK
jgi:Spy/CpxP family protein refolding chaperone